MPVPSLKPRRPNVPELRLPRKEADAIRHTTRWINTSRWYRRITPLCEHCRNALSEEVHHVVPISVDPSMAFEGSNLKALCKRCHRALHNGESEEPRALLG